MILFIDCETTGMPRRSPAPITDLSNWPRMVQLGWLASDEEGNEITAGEQIIKPDGFTIPSDAQRIHGISTKMALEQGLPLRDVLRSFDPLLNDATTVVAHNIQFDHYVIGAEFLRTKIAAEDPFERKKLVCTMLSSTRYCQIPNRYGFKWPTLLELHRKLFNEDFEGSHQALNDVRACARCYFKLAELEVI